MVAENGARIGLHMQRIAVTAVVLFGNGMRGMIRCAGGSDDETECQDVPAFPAGEIRRERVNGLVPAGVFPPAVRSKETIAARKALLVEQRQQLADKIVAMQAVLERLDMKIDGYEERCLKFEEENLRQ